MSKIFIKQLKAKNNKIKAEVAEWSLQLKQIEREECFWRNWDFCFFEENIYKRKYLHKPKVAAAAPEWAEHFHMLMEKSFKVPLLEPTYCFLLNWTEEERWTGSGVLRRTLKQFFFFFLFLCNRCPHPPTPQNQDWTSSLFKRGVSLSVEKLII